MSLLIIFLSVIIILVSIKIFNNTATGLDTLIGLGAFVLIFTVG